MARKKTERGQGDVRGIKKRERKRDGIERWEERVDREERGKT